MDRSRQVDRPAFKERRIEGGGGLLFSDIWGWCIALREERALAGGCERDGWSIGELGRSQKRGLEGSRIVSACWRRKLEKVGESWMFNL